MIARLTLSVLAASCLLAVAGPVHADWLVTVDGERIETRGAWEQKGRLIVFTSADGQLASIRASEIDMEATRAAAEAAAEAETAGDADTDTAPPPPPVLVLTDDDVEHVDPDDFFEADEDTEDEPTNVFGDLEVLGWEETEPPNGTGRVIAGSVRNNGTRVATNIEVTVLLLDANNELLGSRSADLTTSSLNRDELLNFRAYFPEPPPYVDVRFEVSNRSFEPAPVVAPPTDSSAEA